MFHPCPAVFRKEIQKKKLLKTLKRLLSYLNNLLRNIFIVVNKLELVMEKRGKVDAISIVVIILLVILIIWFIVMLSKGA